MGAVIDDYVRLGPTTPLAVGPGRWKGWVLNIDHFGNVVTSFPTQFLGGKTTGFRILAGQVEVSDQAETYASAPVDRVFVIEGSSGYLELSLRQASAAQAAQVEVGDELEWFALA
jgi:S-adenosylmethionine hydrolase